MRAETSIAVSLLLVTVWFAVAWVIQWHERIRIRKLHRQLDRWARAAGDRR